MDERRAVVARVLRERLELEGGEEGISELEADDVAEHILKALSNPAICEVTRDGTIIEVGGDDRCAIVDMGGEMNVAVCDVPVEVLREIGAKWMYQPVRVTISIHEPSEPLLKP